MASIAALELFHLLSEVGYIGEVKITSFWTQETVAVLAVRVVYFTGAAGRIYAGSVNALADSMNFFISRLTGPSERRLLWQFLCTASSEIEFTLGPPTNPTTAVRISRIQQFTRISRVSRRGDRWLHTTLGVSDGLLTPEALSFYIRVLVLEAQKSSDFLVFYMGNKK